MGFFSAGSASAKIIPLQPQCGACGLFKSCRTPKMVVDGDGRRRILIVGDAPSKDDDDRGRPFEGGVGRVLWETLRRGGVTRDDCWTTSSIRCRPPGGAFPEDAVDYCRPYLIQAVNELKPEVIILLGPKAVQSCVGWLWKEAVGEFDRWAGWHIPSQALNAWVCPVAHPASIFFGAGKGGKDPELKKLFFERHLLAACQFKGRPWEQVPDYRGAVDVIHDPDEAAAVLDEFVEQGGAFSFDYETTTKKPDGPLAEIFCCSVCWNGERTISYPWHGSAIKATERLLRSTLKKVGWNMQFEQRWTKAKLGLWIKRWVWDGMEASHVMDSRPGTTGLKFQSFVTLGQNSYDSSVGPYLKSKTEGGNDVNRIREAPLRDVLLYCGMDSLLEWEISKRQAAKMGVEW